jgi:hypothetical protein
MNEYSKDEIVNFFKSKVNLVLADFDTELKEQEWQTDLQIRNPDVQSHWFANTFSASIYASKDGEGRRFYYHIAATPTPAASSNRYNVVCNRKIDQPVSGGGVEGEYHRSINTTSKEQFLKDVKEGRSY